MWSESEEEVETDPFYRLPVLVETLLLPGHLPMKVLTLGHLLQARLLQVSLCFCEFMPGPRFLPVRFCSMNHTTRQHSVSQSGAFSLLWSFFITVVLDHSDSPTVVFFKMCHLFFVRY